MEELEERTFLRSLRSIVGLDSLMLPDIAALLGDLNPPERWRGTC